VDNRTIVVDWILREVYDNNLKRACQQTGFSVKQLTDWRDGIHIPYKSNVRRLMHHFFEPDFTVIAEFKPIEHDGTLKGVHGQLSAILKGFHKDSGVYAFYDSSGSLLYLGKADGRLLEETYTQIKGTVPKGALPKGVSPPENRLSMVRYVSAYRVNESEFEDYAKHVEALILRIHKPPLNTKSGNLEKAQPHSN
jgi:hypothetical protein